MLQTDDEWQGDQGAGLHWEGQGWDKAERCPHLWALSPAHPGEAGDKEGVLCPEKTHGAETWRGNCQVSKYSFVLFYQFTNIFRIESDILKIKAEMDSMEKQLSGLMTKSETGTSQRSVRKFTNKVALHLCFIESPM